MAERWTTETEELAVGAAWPRVEYPMTVPTSTAVAVVAPPQLAGFTTLYGIQVSTIGEDGDLVALGHHDRRTVLAAFLAYYRKVMGDPISLYHDGDSLDIGEMWARLVGQCGGECPQPQSAIGLCDACDHAARDAWFLNWDEVPQPGSFPVTILQM